MDFKKKMKINKDEMENIKNTITSHLQTGIF